MGLEIERRYLVVSEAWRLGASSGRLLIQGYIAKTSSATVRVRREEDAASITVKSERRGIVRDEFTYPVPLADADSMLAGLCGGRVLAKVRHHVEHDGAIWQVDVYAGSAAGLVIAEVELDRADQTFSLPSWVGAEITNDPRYRNSSIANPAWRRAPRPAPSGPVASANMIEAGELASSRRSV